MSEMFQECTSLKRMVLSGLDTGNLLGMDAMFKDCAALEYVDMSGIDTSNIELMMNVFENCTSLRTVDMTGVDMAGISDAAWGEGMLANCTSLETFYAPVNVAAEIGLPVTLYDEAGTAWTSLPQGLTESVRLSKTVKVSYVKINSTAKSIALGKTFQLRAWPQPVNAENKAVTWESSNPSVAAVDSTGLVTAVKAGTADVTVTTADGGFTAVCKITVTVPVTGVKINVTSGEKTIEAGKTFQMAAWPQPSNATNKAVTWSSSNTAVAKVSSSGLVTAAAAGTAVVSVTTADGGFTETCKITVVVPVTSVKINSTAKTLEVGKTFQLAAWPQPTNATNKTVTWTKVSSKGLVTAVKAGSAVITVKTADGGKTAACKITVQAASPATVPVTSVKINSTAKTLEVGKTFQLAAWPQPTNATNKAVTWYSFNTSVATVSSTGLVTAKGKGSTNVRVMTKDGGKIAYCKITVQEASPATVPVTSVKINSTAKTLAPGATFQLAAWPQPANATNKAVTWYSFNTSVATVSSNGLVTAKGTGSTNIRVMTKDGGKIAYCKITVEKPVIPAGYSVSAPTNVHWTDGFKLAWDYGRTQDGSVYQKWAYKMYNAETGAKIGSHSKKDTDGTSIEYFIKTGTIEKMTTGSYYFTVCALDADNNQISPEVRSELKAFTHPNAWAPKPYNLRWSGTKLLFEIPDSAKSKINRMSYDIYYSETENGTYSDKGMPHVMTNIDFSRDFQSRFTKPGYYKFTLKVFNSDPRIIMPGEEAWSPVIHITE